MKKFVLFFVVLFFAGMNVSLAQSVQLSRATNLPVYNYPLTEQTTYFQEPGQGTDNCDKRDMNVVITNSSDAIKDESAVVMLMQIDGNETMGPFTISVGEPLSVEVSKGKWGALVTSRGEMNISIWLDKK